MTLDKTDRELLNRLQQGIPLVPEPYADLGNALCVSGEEVLRRTAALKEDGLIRRLSGFFNGSALGYASVLCAMEVPADRIAAAAEFLNSLPGVTHNYLRDHRLNLWFTLSCRSVEEQDRILRDVEARVGTGCVRRFPATARYKIRAVFDMREERRDNGASAQEKTETDGVTQEKTETSGFPLEKQDAAQGQGGTVPEQGQTVTEKEVPLIRLLQEEFPLCRRPFAALGEPLGLSGRDVLERTDALRREGKLKRIAAALRHHRAGYAANAMVVWDVRRLSAAAAAVVPLPQVTHCYARERAPDFDYNFYTMVHETSGERLDALIKTMEGLIQPVKYCSLKTLRELKKTGMKYFSEEGRA